VGASSAPSSGTKIASFGDGAADPVGIVGGPTGRKTTVKGAEFAQERPRTIVSRVGCREIGADDVIVEDLEAVKSVLIFGLLA